MTGHPQDTRRLRVAPNLNDYEQARAEFDWSAVPEPVRRHGSGGCNIAYAAVDRHTDGPAAKRTALRFISDTGGDTALNHA